MFWNKGNKVEPVSIEAIQVAEFYHKVAAESNLGSETDKWVANHLNTLRPYEVAGMVIDQLRGIDDQSQIREKVGDLVNNFKSCMSDYMAKRNKNLKRE